MTTPTICTRIDDRGVATLTLNRPEVRNAFDDRMLAAAIEELRRLDADAHVRALLLSAAGETFCAGADIGWMRRTAEFGTHENLTDALTLAELMKTLDRLSKPTIALVQGAAFGGGVGLVACCDIVLAAPAAFFCLSEVKLGLIPAVISPYVTAAIGPRAARRYFLTAERFDASEARRLGLVHEVVEREELESRGEALCAHFLQNGPGAMASAKRLIAEVAHRPADDALIALTAERIAEVRASEEGREGLSAFLERRPPAWSRR